MSPINKTGEQVHIAFTFVRPVVSHQKSEEVVLHVFEDTYKTFNVFIPSTFKFLTFLYFNNIIKQESCAIAKMTARCALYK